MMKKIVCVDSTQESFKNDITSIEVILHTKYIDTELVYLTMCEKLKRI